MAEGIDYAWGRPSSLSALKRSGHGNFVCRYLSAGAGGSKDLTRGEANDLTRAGIPIVVVWETTAGRAADGHTAGKHDVHLALDQATACGMPSDRPIFFAVDFDAAGVDVADYFRAVHETIGWRAGVYGGIRSVEYLFNHHLVGWAWQTYAWSGGAWDQRAHLRQYSNDHVVAGVSCDYDRNVFADFGQWRVGWSPAGRTGPPTLKRGARGPWVGVLARNLHFLIDPNTRKPYYAPAIPGLQYTARAYFTGGLEGALRTFQKVAGGGKLPVTGTTTADTWKTIGLAIQHQRR